MEHQIHQLWRLRARWGLLILLLTKILSPIPQALSASSWNPTLLVNTSHDSINILTPSGYKHISDLSVGDEVIGYDTQTSRQVTNHVENIQSLKPEARHYWEHDEEGNNTRYTEVPFTYYLINERWELYTNQSVFTSNGVVHAFELQVGDTMYNTHGQPTTIDTIRSGEDRLQWMSLTVSGNHSYVADDLLMHNASRYWVGGGSSANWNATGNTNWGSASNTQDNASVPTSADDVFFDGVGVGASNSTLSANITIRSLNMTGYANTLTHNSSVTLSIGDGTAGASNIALLLAGTYTLGSATTSAISFVSTSATQQSITTGGKTTGNITFNGSTGSWILVDDWTISGGWTFTAGTWDSTTNSKTITLTAANPIFAGGGKTYYGLTHNASGGAGVTITGTNTFTNLTRNGTAVRTDAITLGANQTVTGVLTLAGNSVVNRILVTSDTLGTARTITNAGATMTWSNVDFRDITLGTAYDASGIAGGSGDAGGNSGITFTTAQTNYWIGGTGSWSTAGEWSTSSGGAANGRVPLPQDDAVFDANSFSTTGLTVTQDMSRAGKNINWTGVTNTPTWTTSTPASFFGSLTLVSGMTLTASAQAYTFEGRSAYTLTNAGKTWAKAISLSAPGGTLTLQDDFNAGTTNTFSVNSGTFDANGKNVTTGLFTSSNSNTRTITLGAGTWTITGNASVVWLVANATNLTFNSGNPVLFNYSGATGTREIRHGNSVGATEANALDVSITAGTDIVLHNANNYLRNVDYTGFAGTLSNIAVNIFGNLTVASGMTLTAGTNATTFAATSGTKTITSNGKTLDFPLTFNGVGGTWQLADALTVGATRTVTLTNGTLDANNQNVSMGLFSSTNSNTRTITMGSGTWTLASTGTVWTTATTTGLTLNQNTSTIKITDTSATANTFSGGGKTFNNIWWSRGASTASNTIVGSNTFADFKDDGSAAHSILFTAGITTTVTTWTVSGTAGNLITINSTSTATHALTKSGGGVISSDYLNIQHSVASPADTWYAGTNSTDNQAVATAGSGWIFSAPPTATATTRRNHFFWFFFFGD